MKNDTVRYVTGRTSKETVEKLDKICEAQGINKTMIITAVVRKIVNTQDPKELEQFLETIGLQKKPVWSL